MWSKSFIVDLILHETIVTLVLTLLSFPSFCSVLPFSSSFLLVLSALLLFLPLFSSALPLPALAFSSFCKVTGNYLYYY